MLEALWSVQFQSNLGIQGAGVVVFETGRIFGGDSQYYYLGSATVRNDGKEVVAEVEVNHYAGQSFSIFGPMKKYKLRAVGNISTPKMTLQGELVEDPSKKFIVILTKRADLP